MRLCNELLHQSGSRQGTLPHPCSQNSASLHLAHATACASLDDITQHLTRTVAPA